MTKMLAIEWAERNIRVNAIAPTTVLTPSREKMLSDPEVRQGMLDRIPTAPFRDARGGRRAPSSILQVRQPHRSPGTRCSSTAA